LDIVKQSLIVSGGGSNLLGINESVSKSIFLNRELGMKTKLHFLQEKFSSTFLGAGILSSLGVFQPLWISKAEYDEYGPSIINRKSVW
jgi:hypothetical protein